MPKGQEKEGLRCVLSLEARRDWTPLSGIRVPGTDRVMWEEHWTGSRAAFTSDSCSLKRGVGSRHLKVGLWNWGLGYLGDSQRLLRFLELEKTLRGQLLLELE